MTTGGHQWFESTHARPEIIHNVPDSRIFTAQPTDYTVVEPNTSFWGKEILGRKRSFWALYVVTPIAIICTILLSMPVLAAIADKALHTAKFDVQSSNITGAGNSSFGLALRAKVSDTGAFPASLEFKKPVDVYWKDLNSQKDLHLGHFNMDRLSASGGTAQVDQQTHFEIDDQAAFGLFAKHLISEQSFTWHIRCSAVHVKAFNALAVYKPLTLDKDIVVQGIHNLPDIKLIDVQLPGDDPTGGIKVIATAQISNPSPFGIEVGTLVLGLYYDGLFLGPVSASEVNLVAGQNQLVLRGRILPYKDNQTALDQLGVLFTNYINSVPTTITARGISATQSNGDTVGWLSQGIAALQADISFVPPAPLDPIKAIAIHDIHLSFNKAQPFRPLLGSNNLTGSIVLPFGFSLNITQLATQLSLVHDGATVGSVSGGNARASTKIISKSSEQMRGEIALSLSTSPMVPPNDTETAKAELITFEKALVYTKGRVPFVAHGSARAIADTPIGQIVLNGIEFNVPTELIGLDGLTSHPTVIHSVEVTGGTKEGITLTIALSLVNPSNLDLSVGNITLHIVKNGAELGTASMRNMSIRPGKNDYNATALFDPNSSPYAGSAMLSDFISGRDSTVDINGFSGSSPLPSLAPVLQALRLQTVLPAIHQKLVVEAVLVVPKNIAQTGIALASVRIANPFASPIDLEKIEASANFNGMTIGTIKQDLLATQKVITAPGKKTTLLHAIPINLNLEPKNLIKFIEAAAKEYHVDLGPLPPFFQQVLDMKDVKTSVKAVPDDETPPCHGSKAFDTLNAVLALLRPLTASLPIRATMKLGEYSTSLSFTQEPVPVKTDRSALYLVGPAASPLIQLIVQQSTIQVKEANATNVVDSGFDVSLRGSLGVKTPADAYITFPDGLTVQYKGVNIATMTLSPLCATAPDGIPDLVSKGRLTITNQKSFTDFTYDLLTTARFEWFLHTKTAVVRTLGIVFSNVTLEKTIQLDGLNGLPELAIADFDSPGDTLDAIKIGASSPIRSAASLGVQLDTASFDIFFQGANLGKIESDKLFLAAKSVTNATFQGVLKSQQDSKDGLAKAGVLFSQYLQGTTSTLTIAGVDARTRANNMKPVVWLSHALQRFSTNITLPGKVKQILFSITLSDLTVTIKDADNPTSIIASNNYTLSTFSNPFGFHLQPIQISPAIVLIYEGVKTATLTIPPSPVHAGISRGPKDIQQLTFGFQNLPLVSLNRAASSRFFDVLAIGSGANFTVAGKTDVVASTKIGNVVITGITFELPTYLKGMGAFGGRAPVSNVVVNDPRPEYLGISLQTQLDNPSNITLLTDRVTLPVYAANGMTPIGLALIPQLNVRPGKNLVPTTFQLYLGGNQTRVLDFLTAFIQPKDFKTAGLGNSIPLLIQGGSNSSGNSFPPITPYPPLVQAMSDLKLKGDLVGIGTRIVVNVRVYIPMSLLMSAISGSKNPAYAFGYIDAVNTLPVQMRFVQLSTSATDTKNVDAGEYSRFTHTFDATGSNSFVLPAARLDGTPSVPLTTSPMISNMLLPKGLLGSLPLIPNNVDTANDVHAYLIGPHGQFFLPGLKYAENDVNTTYFIATKPSGDSGGIRLNEIVGGLKSLMALVGMGGGNRKREIGEALGQLHPNLLDAWRQQQAWEVNRDDVRMESNTTGAVSSLSTVQSQQLPDAAVVFPASRSTLPHSHRVRKVVF